MHTAVAKMRDNDYGHSRQRGVRGVGRALNEFWNCRDRHGAIGVDAHAGFFVPFGHAVPHFPKGRALRTTRRDNRVLHFARFYALREDFLVLARAKDLKVEDASIVGEKPEAAEIVVTPWPSDHRAVVAKVRF
mgnify:CR=1 FL=1